MTGYIFSPDPARVFRNLIFAEIALLAANAAAQFSIFVLGHNHVHGLVPLFVFGDERNFPTFFSLLLLLGSAVLLLWVRQLEAMRNNARIEWAVLAGGFLVMAFDEIFEIHETLGEPTRALLGMEDSASRGLLYFSWVIPALVLCSVIGIYFVGFLRGLPPATFRRFVVAGAMYLGGAIGFEMLGGRHAEVNGRDNLTYHLYSTMEEGLEMAGLIVFIRALLDHCQQNFEVVTLRFQNH